MRIGSQKHLITIQRRVQMGVKKTNEPIFVWQNWREDVFCELTVKRGKEQFDPTSKQRFSEEVWHFRTRFDEIEGLDNTMKIAYDGQKFDIKAILPDMQMRSDCIIECTLQDGVVTSAALMGSILDEVPEGVVGEAYEGFSIKATGGTPGYVFAIEGAGVPGLSVDSSGNVSGMPTQVGSFSIVFKITDAAGATEMLPALPVKVEAA